ncbi:DUF2855 family protein [Marinigracilibium pacificum]|uniref:DUF2855 family protein n=1 Tax=Marinigracilibium pacificum TaxID=2729599 RepID=A0A848JCV5_9BACT|nr:DUF2855 family protein [Marinigracilibium pacificum]NMM50832.1 DUF2855 family protein [Marinigracilibium pacificum]
METINSLDFTVKTDELQKTQFVEKTYSDELAADQVILKINKFSFTTNNITYGVVGEQMNYWKFFPTQSGYGIIPVWGVAEVILSNHPEIQVGQKYYGYYPMGHHLLVTADKVSPRGFIDASEHRQGLSAIYNYYSNTAQDPAFTPETEEYISIFRPLFGTAFLINDFLAEHNFFDAKQIVIISASSKTAQALACLVAHHKSENQSDLNLIGLTSSRNKDFVDHLGWYDKVISYDSVGEIDPSNKTVIVDFAGNHQLQFEIQTLLGENLVYDCHVGFTDRNNLEGENSLPKKPEFFFAPGQAEKRRKEWGSAIFQQNIGKAWQHFLKEIQSKVVIKEHAGKQGLEQLYFKMLNGEIDPQHGNIVSFK